MIIIGMVPANQKGKVAQDTRKYVLANMDSSISHLIDLARESDLELRKKHYNQSRKFFKHVEFFIAAVSEYDLKYHINGPLISKLDQQITGEVFNPNGFQLIEEFLYSNHRMDIENEVCNELIPKMRRMREYYTHIEIRDGLLLEMMQLHVYRIVAVNLNGFDATYNLNNVNEAIWNLEGMEAVLDNFTGAKYMKPKSKKVLKVLKREIQKSKKVLRSNTEFESFNRLKFIQKSATELNRCILEFHNSTGLKWNTQVQGIDLQQENLFVKEAFDPRFFSPFSGLDSMRQKMAHLGKILFFDPVLSGNGKRSCASCHKPQNGFSDGLPTSIATDQERNLKRNATGLTNIKFQQKFFYDGRVFQLERQVFEVVGNHFEMRGDLDNVVRLLRQSKEYKRLFNQAYEGRFDTIITRNSIQKAIGEYERSLVGMNSRFDYFLRGSNESLDDREINGYNLFAGKALCGSCHFFPVFNGTIPPLYKDAEFEVIGVAQSKENNILDQDMGLFNLTKKDIHKRSFKTPTVRNISYTGPYMHNGAYESLEEVLEFYHKGGGAGFGMDVPNQTLPFDSLRLDKREKEDIILFMKSLNDTLGLNSAPDFLPQFENHTELNLRRVGGEY